MLTGDSLTLTSNARSEVTETLISSLLLSDTLTSLAGAATPDSTVTSSLGVSMCDGGQLAICNQVLIPIIGDGWGCHRLLHIFGLYCCSKSGVCMWHRYTLLTTRGHCWVTVRRTLSAFGSVVVIVREAMPLNLQQLPGQWQLHGWQHKQGQEMWVKDRVRTRGRSFALCYCGWVSTSMLPRSVSLLSHFQQRLALLPSLFQGQLDCLRSLSQLEGLCQHKWSKIEQECPL